MKLLKSVSQRHDDGATPNRRMVELIDLEGPSELPLRPATTRRPRGKPPVISSSSSSSSRSSSRPIPISMDEQRHRHRELQDMAEAESFYAKATWRMYRRITKYRMDHPLPDCYFDRDNDDDTTTSQRDDHQSINDHTERTEASESTLDQSSIDFTKTTFIKNHAKHKNRDDAKRPSQSLPQNDIDDDDDEKEEHCMMFELDLA